MDYHYITTVKAAVALLLLICVRLSSPESDGVKDHPPPPPEDHPKRIPDPTIIDTAKTLFSLPNTRLSLIRAAASNYWLKLNHLFFNKHGSGSDGDSLSPTAPTLDFRERRRGDDDDDGGELGAGEKVKEAMVKSLDKSKAAMEDTARSAAKLAGDAAENAAHKVKATLSSSKPISAESEDEL